MKKQSIKICKKQEIDVKKSNFWVSQVLKKTSDHMIFYVSPVIF